MLCLAIVMNNSRYDLLRICVLYYNITLFQSKFKENNMEQIKFPTIKLIRKTLEDRNLAELHRKTGISKETLNQIRRGGSTNPSTSTYTTLCAYLWPEQFKVDKRTK